MKYETAFLKESEMKEAVQKRIADGWAIFGIWPYEWNKQFPGMYTSVFITFVKAP